MSKLMKMLLTFTSWAMLFFIYSFTFLLDGLWTKKIANNCTIGIILFIFGIILTLLFYAIIKSAKKKLEKHSIIIKNISNADPNLIDDIGTYLLPLLTISISDVNFSVLLTMFLVILLVVWLTRATLKNPLFIFFGYRQFDIYNENGRMYKLITKTKKINLTEKHDVVELFDEIYLEV
ncbi:uncharacterized protein BN794_00580 [Coprobacillus sp. CAG:826]|nr:uncharacterized protein BN794_00580 [Coprobacillus sp. CAG:826]